MGRYNPDTGCTEAAKTLTIADGRTLLGFPTDMAAFYGHVEMLELLLRSLKTLAEQSFARMGAIVAAGRNNQAGTLQVCLDATNCQKYEYELREALYESTSLEIFNRIYSQCRDVLIHNRPSHGRSLSKTAELRRESKFLSEQFHMAAVRGNLAKMKYLVQLGVSSRCDDYQDINLKAHNDYYNRYHFKNLVSIAALGGHTDVMEYLLENGAQIGSRSLEAASKHGSADSVRILLKYGTPQSV